MGILNRIKLALGINLGYNRNDFNYNSAKISVGEMKQIGRDEFIKNENGQIVYCRKKSNGKMFCKKIPTKHLFKH